MEDKLAGETMVRPREEDADIEFQEAPSMKRKKTVTWADGDEEGGHYGGEGDTPGRADDQGEGPVAIKIEGVDELFSDLREAALREQQPLPRSEGDPLTTEELHARRADRLSSLETAYKAEFWSLADEFLLRSWNFRQDNPEEGAQRTTRSRSKFHEIGKQSIVQEALLDRGVEGAWLASYDFLRTQGGDNAAAAPLNSMPDDEELSDFIFHLPLPDVEENIEAVRQRLVKRREEFLRNVTAIGRLEASASAATSRELDRQGAIAALCGSSARYFIRRTAVTFGRGVDSGVDVDLNGEGGAAAAKVVSRQQAHLFLDADGGFKVRCIGRRAMVVNGQTLKKGQVAALPHLSLLLVGPLALLFVVNLEAMDRVAKRSAALNVA